MLLLTTNSSSCHFCFTDIVGFTSICDKVDPWEVIDLLNQLYSVMDFLASHFKLYKIETIGDAYMCCSGLPIPDIYHAENIANFSIAVQECVKQIHSPIDGKPIQLRIGIHTGHCTAGVVGTLTPHFCLFGDLVNATARHEQTSESDKIQCSNELYRRLKYLRNDDKEQFVFEQRGYVDMKGKGKCLTYFLEGASPYNQYCRSTALDELSEHVNDMLESRKWKRRRYFRRSGSFQSSLSSVTLSEQLSSVALYEQPGPSSILSHTDTVRKNAVWDISHIIHDNNSKPHTLIENPNDNIEDNSLHEVDDMIDIFDEVVGKQSIPRFHVPKSQIHIGETREEQVETIYVTLLHSLLSCLNHFHDKVVVDDKFKIQLMNYIERISLQYNIDNQSHNLGRTTYALVWSDLLYKHIAKYDNCFQEYPWYHLILLFSVLVKDCKHFGLTNEQLKCNKHPICDYYGSNDAQYKYSLQVGIDLLVEEFPNLYNHIMKSCPDFIHHLRCTVLQRIYDFPTNFQDETIEKKREIWLKRILGKADSIK